MLQVKRIIQLAIFALVVVSGLLLGLSLGSPQLAAIAIVGGVLGFLCVDVFKLFQLQGMIANLASILILVIAMKDFLPGDSTDKLISVANLLVYLQTVLMFQEKTPRLNWQIMVLSLLQVVVAAIFSLDFEGGMLFMLYFIVAGATLLIQSIFKSNTETARRNRFAAHQLATFYPDLKPADDFTLSDRRQSSDGEPVAFYDAEVQSTRPLRMMAMHLALWALVAYVFTSILFYMIPRHTKPWFGPNKQEVTSVGYSKSVNLRNESRIFQSEQVMFRVEYKTYGANAEELEIADAPYFRGMALSSLIIEDGQTNWVAPHDRINDEVYQKIADYQGQGTPFVQTVTLEESADPLVYATMPVFRTGETAKQIEFCHEASALTRCHLFEKIDLAPYQYTLGGFLEDGRFCKTWPYLANSGSHLNFPMSMDQPQHDWLTLIDKARYPGLVATAERIRKEMKPGSSRIDYIKALESYFLGSRFQYTVDFTDVEWTADVDPVEDFCTNHRTGHCELFASSLTLMLRSQGIPARLVVGFHGGEKNSLNRNILVRGTHAHAWVEVYLRPEDCASEMVANGTAGRGGAWMIADGTPPTAIDENTAVGNDAIDLARTMWQDYVLGMDSDTKAVEDSVAVSVPFFEILQRLDVENWEESFEELKSKSDSPIVKAVLVGALLLPFFIMWIVSLFRDKEKKKEETQQVSAIRRWMAGAISLISPSLGQWMIEGNVSRPTAFYDRLTKILEPKGHVRKPSQTHREFAKEVSGAFSDHPGAALIDSTVWEITELFNDVRFGSQELSPELMTQVELSLNELKDQLAVESATVANAV